MAPQRQDQEEQQPEARPDAPRPPAAPAAQQHQRQGCRAEVGLGHEGLAALEEHAPQGRRQVGPDRHVPGHQVEQAQGVQRPVEVGPTAQARPRGATHQRQRGQPLHPRQPRREGRAQREPPRSARGRRGDSAGRPGQQPEAQGHGQARHDHHVGRAGQQLQAEQHAQAPAAPALRLAQRALDCHQHPRHEAQAREVVVQAVEGEQRSGQDPQRRAGRGGQAPGAPAAQQPGRAGAGQEQVREDVERVGRVPRQHPGRPGQRVGHLVGGVGQGRLAEARVRVPDRPGPACHGAHQALDPRVPDPVDVAIEEGSAAHEDRGQQRGHQGAEGQGREQAETPHAACGSRTAGRRTSTSVPWPGRLRRLMSPPCSRTML